MWSKISEVLTGTIGQTALGAAIGVGLYNLGVWGYNKGAAILEARKEVKA
jgi:hypothetical protein